MLPNLVTDIFIFGNTEEEKTPDFRDEYEYVNEI